MANVFYSLRDLRTEGALQHGDKIIFTVREKQYTYSVRSNFLDYPGQDNDIIFAVLGLSKTYVAERCYGTYSASNKTAAWHGFPEASGSEGAKLVKLYRITEYLFQEIQNRNLHRDEDHPIPFNKPQVTTKPMLKQLSKTLKRVLNSSLQSLYKIGWINGDLELTETGKDALWTMLLEKHEEELAKEADERIAAIKKSQAK